jgi:type 1 glutamine amidotransferase
MQRIPLAVMSAALLAVAACLIAQTSAPTSRTSAPASQASKPASSKPAKLSMDDKAQLIAQAAPAKATTAPAKARKLLVFGQTAGFAHDSIPVVARAFEIVGSRTGAWETVVSNDPAMFEPESLAKFDAVCMNSTTGELFGFKKAADATKDETNMRRRKALLDFVSGGKGLVGIHAATDCSYEWPEYGQMIGGYFDGHPFRKIQVKVEDPRHPLNAAFDGDFEITDEIYTFKAPYSRDKLRVLLSIDATKTDVKAGKRADKDYALSWVKSYGSGRVFYCAFGHEHQVLWNPAILRHLLDGTQFALGDLPADTTPKPAP